MIGRSVLTTPPYGPFFRAAGAQSATQSWHTDPLTPTVYVGPEKGRVNVHFVQNKRDNVVGRGGERLLFSTIDALPILFHVYIWEQVVEAGRIP